MIFIGDSKYIFLGFQSCKNQILDVFFRQIAEVKFEYSGKATQNWKNRPLCSDVISDNILDIVSNFVAFSQYLNFMTSFENYNATS